MSACRVKKCGADGSRVQLTTEYRMYRMEEYRMYRMDEYRMYRMEEYRMYRMEEYRMYGMEEYRMYMMEEYSFQLTARHRCAPRSGRGPRHQHNQHCLGLFVRSPEAGGWGWAWRIQWGPSCRGAHSP